MARLLRVQAEHARRLNEFHARRFERELVDGERGKLKREVLQHVVSARKRDTIERRERERIERHQLRRDFAVPTWSGWLEARTRKDDSQDKSAARTQERTRSAMER